MRRDRHEINRILGCSFVLRGTNVLAFDFITSLQLELGTTHSRVRVTWKNNEINKERLILQSFVHGFRMHGFCQCHLFWFILIFIVNAFKTYFNYNIKNKSDVKSFYKNDISMSFLHHFQF